VIRKLLQEDSITIELLFLNPDSEQAHFRAFREYSLKSDELNREAYLKSPSAHSNSVLYKDTSEARAALEALVKEVARTKPRDWVPRLRAGFYDSAPYCFLLRADDQVLIEQYHYGKLPDDQLYDRGKLGKEVPLVEYAAEPSGIFDLTNKTPFELFASHFDFALQESVLLPVAEWAAAADRRPLGFAAKQG
jgi:hypothetical protein